MIQVWKLVMQTMLKCLHFSIITQVKTTKLGSLIVLLLLLDGLIRKILEAVSELKRLMETLKTKHLKLISTMILLLNQIIKYK
jgi:hypothetical protein